MPLNEIEPLSTWGGARGTCSWHVQKDLYTPGKSYKAAFPKGNCYIDRKLLIIFLELDSLSGTLQAGPPQNSTEVFSAHSFHKKSLRCQPKRAGAAHPPALSQTHPACATPPTSCMHHEPRRNYCIDRGSGKSGCYVVRTLTPIPDSQSWPALGSKPLKPLSSNPSCTCTPWHFMFNPPSDLMLCSPTSKEQKKAQTFHKDQIRKPKTFQVIPSAYEECETMPTSKTPRQS